MESQCKTHCLTPFREVWLTACRFVQRLTGEAVCRISYFDTPRKLFMQKVPDAFCILLYGAPVKFLIGFGYPTVKRKIAVRDEYPVSIAVMA